MPAPDGSLDVRRTSDRADLLPLLAIERILVQPEAIASAITKLPEEWLIAWPMWGSAIFNIPTAPKENSAIHLDVWADVVSFIYELREVPGINEQIRRLCTRSHEALDTILSLRVAGRYLRKGFAVSFEPNGNGCSDLMIQRGSSRYYVEVKRENEQHHKRLANIQALASTVDEQLGGLRVWLSPRAVRLEIKFRHLFSRDIIPSIVDEIRCGVAFADPHIEAELSKVRGQYVVLPKDYGQFFYNKGIHHFVLIGDGTVQRSAPPNMPIVVTFDALHNRTAFKARLRKAARQLSNDRDLDPGAKGFVVFQAAHGPEARETVKASSVLLSSNCLGVVLISDSIEVISPHSLTWEDFSIMKLAGQTEK